MTLSGPDDLIAEIRKKTVVPERVAEAFRAVPRGNFIETIYVHQRLHIPKFPMPASSVPSVVARWDRVDKSDVETWLDLVNRDQVLVTKLDEQGIPISSSTAPSLMATMLAHTGVAPGDHVLEIGTGTGYNAALLAHMVGPSGHVTTVEIDAAAAAAATLRLRDWPNVSVVVADGWHGYSPSAPFHRVICTAGLSCLCPEWIFQLREEGIFLASLQTEFTAAIARLTRRRYPDRLTGGFVRGLAEGGFIPLRSPHRCGDDSAGHVPVGKRSSLVQVLEEANAGPRYPIPDELARMLLNAEPDFMLLIQLACPALAFRQLSAPNATGPEFVLITCSEGAAVLRSQTRENESPYLQGSLRVAQTCLRAFGLWDSLEAPSVTAYELTLTGDGAVTAGVLGTELAAEIYRCKMLEPKADDPC